MPLFSAFKCRFCITILLVIVGVLLSSSDSFILLAILIYANALPVIMPSFSFSSIAQLLPRSLPRRVAVGNLIQELTYMVQRWYPDSSPLVENSARTWAFNLSRSINRCTGDPISGSLACAVLMSFLISRHETPIYVFLVWAILVAAYFMINRAILPKNDGDSTSG